MKLELVTRIERFLEGKDFGKNWDGAYQDAVPAIRSFFDKDGFRTEIMSERDSPSRLQELVAVKEAVVIRIPWAEDANGLSIVDLNGLEVESATRHATK